MKTVMDAVNEFKGEWREYNSLSSGQRDQQETIIYECTEHEGTGYTVGQIVFGLETYCTVSYKRICNKSKFNQCTTELSNHAGIELFNEYVKADKKLLEKESKVIDWSETEYLFSLNNKGKGLVEFFERKPSTSNCEEWWMVSTSETLYLKTAWKLIEKPKSQPKESNMKPIYTQEMSDNGELPSVGELVQIRRDYGDDNEFYNGKLIAENLGVVWFTDDKYGGCLHSLNEVTIQPIDTRTDKEKAIDEACLIIDDSKRCIDTNINIHCSAAQKAVIITMIERGYTKGGK